MAEKRVRAIECEAEVWSIKSRQDMTYDVTFQFPEYMIEQVQWLMAHMHDAVKLVIEREDGRKNGK